VKCPWRVGVDPRSIPNGYEIEKHKALASTIAKPGDISPAEFDRAAMACHEEHSSHCIGWLVNQVGRGNNIPLRIRMLSCENAGEISTRGKQHPNFEATLSKVLGPDS